jgi:pimeloyl-ACP methyl ester carboxylesterase
MAAAEAAPFAVGPAPTIRGESAGEGPPIVLCHGLTATRRYVIHGSHALERAGHRVISYDARAHGESDPAPPDQGYELPWLVADLERVIAAEVGEEGPLVIAGHSMGAHTAVAYALRHPTRLTGLVVIGPVLEPTPWEGLATALEEGGVDGFVDYIDRTQEINPAWRDSVLDFTRTRMLLHRHPEALAGALREISGSRPLESLAELEQLDIPVLVVASHDDTDPGHPYAAAVAYAEHLPRAELISEEEGESPLAWQGGKLARELAAFYAKALSSSL